MLEVRDLHVHYGSIRALKGISLEVKEGEMVALIGANGAGKTTLLNTLSGFNRPKQGEILFRGGKIQGLPPNEIVARGMIQVPEGRSILTQMTVLENLEMGAYIRKDSQEVRRDLDKILERFPRLQERRGQLGGTLSGGEQQMLAIGRALMGRPQILLLDEPSMGLSPLLVREVFQIIREIKTAGTTILLVEQNARMALREADRGYVLENGSIVFQESAGKLLQSRLVQEAYLGAGECQLLTRRSRNQTGLRHRKIRNPNIEIRNKFKFQMVKNNKPRKDI